MDLKGLKSETKYIACQAPLESTIKDFWRMVWERYVSVIIMLANIYEPDKCFYDEKKTNSKKKCDVYWPETPGKLNYGDMIVTLVKEYDRGDYVVRKLVVEAVSLLCDKKIFIHCCIYVTFFISIKG
jgi:protein tyrosine phosphatase